MTANSGNVLTECTPTMEWIEEDQLRDLFVQDSESYYSEECGRAIAKLWNDSFVENKQKGQIEVLLIAYLKGKLQREQSIDEDIRMFAKVARNPEQQDVLLRNV